MVKATVLREHMEKASCLIMPNCTQNGWMILKRRKLEQVRSDVAPAYEGLLLR